MNDRYLFKAKGQTDGKWHTGLLANLQENKCIIHESDRFEWICNPDTICQCTGLKDKAGTLIWENDLVKHFDAKGIIRFGEDRKIILQSIGFYVDWNKVYYRQDLGYWLNKISVIGSAIDNPKLLEVER